MAKVRAHSPSSLDYWLKKVDPEHVLDPAERRRRAAFKKQEHMQRMALKSAHARKKRTA